MSMFDSIVFDCNECGKEVDFQTKDGRCNLDRFSLNAVPRQIAVEINNLHCKCNCGVIYKLTTNHKKQSNISDCVVMKAKAIRFEYGDLFP